MRYMLGPAEPDRIRSASTFEYRRCLRSAVGGKTGDRRALLDTIGSYLWFSLDLGVETNRNRPSSNIRSTVAPAECSQCREEETER